MNCVECPRIKDKYFDDICTSSKAEIESRFGGKFWEQLRNCLNNLPSMKRLQEKRKQNKPAFAGELKRWSYHWFAFNYGGYDEAQFNIGMGPDYVRIGLGFQLNQKKREEVERIYGDFVKRFSQALKSKRFEELFIKQCVVEWVSNKDERRLRDGKLPPVLGVHIEDAVSFMGRKKTEDIQDIAFIFVGWLLWHNCDKRILRDGKRLRKVINNIFDYFSPLREETMKRAKGKQKG